MKIFIVISFAFIFYLISCSYNGTKAGSLDVSIIDKEDFYFTESVFYKINDRIDTLLQVKFNIISNEFEVLNVNNIKRVEVFFLVDTFQNGKSVNLLYAIFRKVDNLPKEIIMNKNTFEEIFSKSILSRNETSIQIVYYESVPKVISEDFDDPFHYSLLFDIIKERLPLLSKKEGLILIESSIPFGGKVKRYSYKRMI